MAVVWPITLIGNNLGRRHQYLNDLVNNAFKRQIPFESIQDLPEVTPIDRLFKIDLASKYRCIDFILKCFKDEDMLYVSRALKCVWLFRESQFSELLTPHYVEQFLYPEMTMVATKKMKQWIALNLKDEVKCQMFYEYYFEKDFKYAIKFFPKCSAGYVVDKLISIPFSNMTPHFMKLLCENTPAAAQVYFDILKNKSEDLPKENNKKKNCISIVSELHFLLKRDPDKFFYLIENIYDPHLKRFNKQTTKYIMNNHRARFEAKPELYVERFLDLQTLSKYLSNDNIKELVIKLMRAKFIPFFYCTYKFAEPLLKCIDKNEKTKFCRTLFEENSYGEKITLPPYFIPCLKNHQHESYDPPKDYDFYLEMKKPRVMLAGGYCPGPNRLAILFDQYRFKGYEKTFADLKKAILKESNIENRQNMFLVLISKTGGKAEHLRSIIKFLFSRHSNEPASLRATLVRSLVKRASVWRVSPDVWDMLLRFGYDLGLDGRAATAPCVEGLHGVVLHDIIKIGSISQPVLNAYLCEFNPLSEYSLTDKERKQVINYVLGVLMEKAKNDGDDAPNRFNQVLDLLNAHRLKLEHHIDVIQAIKGAITGKNNAFRQLLERIFHMKVARKTFFFENFQINKTDLSYINALRHDVNVLTDEKHFNSVLDENRAKCLQHFIRKLILYFGEENGLATFYLNITKKRITADNPKTGLARIIAFLSSREELTNLCDFLSQTKTSNNKRLIAALWSNIHFTRPHSPFEIDKIKAKSYLALGNYIHTCSPVLLNQLMPKILLHSRLARQCLALRAPFTTGLITKTLPSAAKNRRLRALQIALRILRNHNHVYTKEDWDTLKNLIEHIDLIKKQRHVYLNLVKINTIPKEFRIEYCVFMYRALIRAKLGSEIGPPYFMTNSILPCIYDNLEKADSFGIHDIIMHFLNEQFSINKILSGEAEYLSYVENFIKIIVSFVMCNCNDKYDGIQNIAKPLLEQLKNCSHKSFDMKRILSALTQPLTELKMNDHECVDLMELLMKFYNDAIPIVDYFKLHVAGRLSTFMRHSLRKCVEREPTLFRDRAIHKNENFIQLLGAIYAEILIQDAEDMTKKYFDSILPMYADSIRYFIGNTASLNYSNQKIFTLSLIKTILQDYKRPTSMYLGILLCRNVSFEDNEKKSVMELISNADDSRVQLIRTHVFKNV